MFIFPNHSYNVFFLNLPNSFILIYKDNNLYALKKQTAVGTKTVNEAAKKAKKFSAAIQPTFAKTVNGLNKLTNPDLRIRDKR